MINGSLLAGGGSRSHALKPIDCDGAGRPTGIAIGSDTIRAAGEAGTYAIDIAIAVDIEGAIAVEGAPAGAIAGAVDPIGGACDARICCGAANEANDGPIIDGESGGVSSTAA